MEASEFKKRFLPLGRRLYWAAWRLTENREEADDLYYEAELRDQALQARRLIDKLPERQRRVITLRDIEDRPYDEIATTTGLTQVNVRALLSRARKTIRENFRKLTHDGYDK